LTTPAGQFSVGTNNVVSDFLTSRGIKFFTEHDGFRTSHEIDVDALLQEIQTKTGFKMKLKKE
jgi:hypothetical protein